MVENNKQRQQTDDNPAILGEISIGEKLCIQSKTLGEERELWVSLPESYIESDPEQNYPVLYVIDGKEHFVPAAGVVRFMSAGVNFNKQIPELIVVAIPSIRTGPVI